MLSLFQFAPGSNNSMMLTVLEILHFVSQACQQTHFCAHFPPVRILITLILTRYNVKDSHWRHVCDY